MPDIKTQVYLSNYSQEKMSRHDMLDWVNTTVNGHYKKIEELCSGVAYCQMMELLHPNCIGQKRIKAAAKLEHEFLHNLKLLQNSFTSLKMDNTVPIDRLVRGRFQDNFEFLQWFKKFFDTHAKGKSLQLAPAVAPPKPIRKMPPKTSAPPKSKTSVEDKENAFHTPPPNDSRPSSRDSSVSPSSLDVLMQTKRELHEKMLAIEGERDYYFKKLTSIETILNEGSTDEQLGEWCKKSLAVLYNTGDEDAGDLASDTADI